MRSIVCALLLFGTGCDWLPEAYAPPPQVAMPSGSEPAASPGDGMLIAISDPDADAHILGDVYKADPGAEWRFTALHPKFRFEIPRVTPFGFYLRFYDPAEALVARGPVSFSVTINGRRFHSPRFAGAGDQEYRRPIPDDWITKPGTVDVSIDFDQAWHSPDGTTYGVLVNSIGFEERQP